MIKNRFSRQEAITRCERILISSTQHYHTCYYFDGRCEIHGECYGFRDCGDYVPDVPFTNLIHKNILEKPNWCRENWDKLYEVDKELFNAIWNFNGVREL